MKYRGSGKIKKQHGMIAGLRKLLEQIESWQEIKSIIPGRIEPARQGGKISLRMSYRTESGIKLIAKSTGGVQEVFVVSNDVRGLVVRLEAEGLI